MTAKRTKIISWIALLVRYTVLRDLMTKCRGEKSKAKGAPEVIEWENEKLLACVAFIATGTCMYACELYADDLCIIISSRAGGEY